jgi:hypothetical protein
MATVDHDLPGCFLGATLAAQADDRIGAWTPRPIHWWKPSRLPIQPSRHVRGADAVPQEGRLHQGLGSAGVWPGLLPGAPPYLKWLCLRRWEQLLVAF